MKHYTLDMSSVRPVVFALIGASLVSACEKTPASTEAVKSAADVAAPTQADSRGLPSNEKLEEIGKTAEALQGRGAVEPVPSARLVGLLPAAPAGFDAEEPTANDLAMGDMKVTNAERRFIKGDSDVRVTITDASFSPSLYAPIAMAAEMAKDGPDGYEKGVTIAGNPGIERWAKESRSGELAVMVDKRFIVTVAGNGVETAFLRQVFGTIDVSKLAALK